MLIPENNCTNCGKRLDAVDNLGEEEEMPEPGNFTVCLGCGHVMVFAEGLSLRDPDDSEIHEIAGNPELLKIMKMSAAFQLWKASEGKQ